MFFRKSRREKEADARQQFITGVGSSLEEALREHDVATRYLKLVEARNGIDEQEAALRAAIRQQASNKGDALYLGTAGTGAAVGALALFGLHFPPLFVVAGPLLGWYYGLHAGRDLAISTQEKALNDNKPFFDAAETWRRKINAATSEIERTQLQELAASPKCGDILKKAPSLRDQFAAAFGRQATDAKNQPAPQTKPANDGFKL